MKYVKDNNALASIVADLRNRVNKQLDNEPEINAYCCLLDAIVYLNDVVYQRELERRAKDGGLDFDE